MGIERGGFHGLRDEGEGGEDAGEPGFGEAVEVGGAVIISTTKPDKYDRYLADVFVGGLKGESMKMKDGASDPTPARSVSQLLAASKRSEDGSTFNAQLRVAPVFLNNALLENGHAIRYEGRAKEEF